MSTANQDWNITGEEHAPSTTQSPLPGSSGLILAFLALNLRHCRRTLREYLVPRVRGLENARALSAYFAILAKRHLSSSDVDSARPDVEGVQLRLMLSLYDWTMDQSQYARRLLCEAVSLADEIGLTQAHRARRGSSPMSIAMAFEAESMGISTVSESADADTSDYGAHAEVMRRTTWSLFLLDTQYALVDHRTKLICNTDNFPPLASSKAAFTRNDAQITIFQDDERFTGWLRQQIPDPPNVQTWSSPEFCPPLTPSMSSTSSNGLPDATDGKVLSHYILYVSLFHRIHVWAHSKPWRSVSPDSGFGLC